MVVRMFYWDLIIPSRKTNKQEIEINVCKTPPKLPNYNSVMQHKSVAEKD